MQQLTPKEVIRVVKPKTVIKQ